LLYSAFIGGSGYDGGHAIAVDAQGYAYIAGSTDSTDFPTVNALQPAFGGLEGDGFVAKLSWDGSSLLYSTYLGGDDTDSAMAITVDASGSAYVTGYVASTDFPTAIAIQAGYMGGGDAFVTKLTPAGSALSYSTYLGGGGDDRGQAIDLDGSGNIYVAGSTWSTDFPTNSAISPSLAQGDQDAFLTKLNAAGSTVVYSTYFGGTARDQAHGIDVDLIGSVYLAGRTASTDFPTTPEAPQNAPGGGGDDAFAARLSSDGSSLIFSSYIGGAGVDAGNGIAIDAAGNAFVTGFTSSSNFPTLRPYQGSLLGHGNAIVTAFSATGKGLYSTFLGSTDGDAAEGIALDSRGDVYIAGWTDATDFPTVMPLIGSNSGTRDAFISKLARPLDFWVASANSPDALSRVTVQARLPR
jgi:hypothetical protein